MLQGVDEEKFFISLPNSLDTWLNSFVLKASFLVNLAISCLLNVGSTTELSGNLTRLCCTLSPQLETTRQVNITHLHNHLVMTSPGPDLNLLSLFEVLEMIPLWSIGDALWLPCSALLSFGDSRTIQIWPPVANSIVNASGILLLSSALKIYI